MKDNNKAALIIATTCILTAFIAAGIIVATGKILVLEVDGLTGKKEDCYGNYEEQHVDGGKLRFYTE